MATKHRAVTRRQHKTPVVIDEVLKRASEVIGDHEEAYRWMGTPVRALGYETPIAMLATAEGMKAVLAVLGQLEHGVY